jgi:hypothetical protein
VGLLATVVGASLQLPSERLGRVVIFGQLCWLATGVAVLVVGLVAR